MKKNLKSVSVVDYNKLLEHGVSLAFEGGTSWEDAYRQANDPDTLLGYIDTGKEVVRVLALNTNPLTSPMKTHIAIVNVADFDDPVRDSERLASAQLRVKSDESFEALVQRCGRILTRTPQLTSFRVRTTETESDWREAFLVALYLRDLDRAFKEAK